jgi:hypothetical protein
MQLLCYAAGSLRCRIHGCAGGGQRSPKAPKLLLSCAEGLARAPALPGGRVQRHLILLQAVQGSRYGGAQAVQGPWGVGVLTEVGEVRLCWGAAHSPGTHAPPLRTAGPLPARAARHIPPATPAGPHAAGRRA